MVNLKLDRNEPMYELTEYLNDTKYTRNEKAKTYHYCAKLSNYQSAHNIDREFFDVTDYTNNEGWSLSVSSTFLISLQVGDIVEICVNIRSSRNYSNVSKSYFVVMNKNDLELDLEFFDTPYKAFKNLKK